MNLPNPGERGEYVLPRGSTIYPSGKDFKRDGVPVKMPNKGKFMLWVKTGYEVVADNKRIAVGHFVMDPFYFATADLALEHFKEMNSAISN